MMRFSGICAGLLGLSLFVLPARAYENFIPLGTGYSTSVSSIPAIKSERQRIIEQTDIYETEIYNKQLQERIFTSRSGAFFDNPQGFNSDRSIDY